MYEHSILMKILGLVSNFRANPHPISFIHWKYPILIFISFILGLFFKYLFCHCHYWTFFKENVMNNTFHKISQKLLGSRKGVKPKPSPHLANESGLRDARYSSIYNNFYNLLAIVIIIRSRTQIPLFDLRHWRVPSHLQLSEHSREKVNVLFEFNSLNWSGRT